MAQKQNLFNSVFSKIFKKIRQTSKLVLWEAEIVKVVLLSTFHQVLILDIDATKPAVK